MSARELPGERPLGTPLAELSSPNRISMEVLMPPHSADDGAIAEPPEVPGLHAAGFHVEQTGLSFSRRAVTALAPALLTTAALVLSSVGIAINGWFALSLGASEVAGWLFLAIGVAADLAALVLPAAAAGLWHTGQRVTALVGWVVWFGTFVFAVTAGIGFASSNISDSILMRASRVTPAVTSTQAALADAMSARDRECKIVGKFCREREAAVAEQRRLLDAAMTRVAQTADPQTDAAIKLVAWISRGMLRPVPEDFAMLRLSLLALLPQIGRMLLLISRHQQGRPVLPQPSPSATGQGAHGCRRREARSTAPAPGHRASVA
jgi:hypothetical protein